MNASNTLCRWTAPEGRAFYFSREGALLYRGGLCGEPEAVRLGLTFAEAEAFVLAQPGPWQFRVDYGHQAPEGHARKVRRSGAKGWWYDDQDARRDERADQAEERERRIPLYRWLAGRRRPMYLPLIADEFRRGDPAWPPRNEVEAAHRRVLRAFDRFTREVRRADPRGTVAAARQA